MIEHEVDACRLYQTCTMVAFGPYLLSGEIFNE